MKKFLLSIVAILCAAFAANADVWTYNFEQDYTRATWFNNLCKSSGTTSEIIPTATEGENALKGITWKYTQEGSSIAPAKDGTAPKGVRWGAASSQINTVKFSTSGFSGKKITSVSVKICGNGGTNCYAVKVSCGEFAETKEDVLLNTKSNTAVSAVFSPNVTSTDLEFAIVYTGGTTYKGGVKFLEVSVSYEDSQEVVYPTSCSTPVFAVAGYKADVDTYGTFPGKTVSVSCDTPESSIIWSVFVNGGSEQKLTGDVFTIPVDAKAEDKYEFMAHGQVQGKDGIWGSPFSNQRSCLF